jgi:hypothetical protein
MQEDPDLQNLWKQGYMPYSPPHASGPGTRNHPLPVRGQELYPGKSLDQLLLTVDEGDVTTPLLGGGEERCG